MLKILLSNDDGVHAPGLNALAEELKSICQLTVVAPDRDHSGVSNALTLTRPMHATPTQQGYLSINGTPTDCVHLAITGLIKEMPDMVVSGINSGANLGDDVLYSGTVAAATEGRFLGYPAIAVSLAGSELTYYQTAVQVVLSLLQHMEQAPLPGDTILNVNVPDLPLSEIKGIKVTRLGYRHVAEGIREDRDPRGRKIYWVGPAGEGKDCGEGTDFHAIENGYVSMTPLQVDLTDHQTIPALNTWVSKVNL